MIQRATSINELNKDLFAPDAADWRSDPLEARKKALDCLARREYGRRELFDKLVGIGFAPDVAEAALERLTAEGLQDERRFIEDFMQSRIKQGKGPVRIRAELRERGADPGVVGELLDNSDTDWTALASAVRRKKFGRALPGDFKAKARQMRFLQYRGFGQEHIDGAFSRDSRD